MSLEQFVCLFSHVPLFLPLIQRIQKTVLLYLLLLVCMLDLVNKCYEKNVYNYDNNCVQFYFRPTILLLIDVGM